jgi:nucleoside-diphosphate-sugar epimerase
MVAGFADASTHNNITEPYGDGTQTRHPRCGLRLHLRVRRDEDLTGVHNVGTGVAYSLTDIATLIDDALDLTIRQPAFCSIG